MMPAVVLLLIMGIWMVLADSEWSFAQPGVPVALGLFAIAFLVGAVDLSQAAIAIERGAGGLA